MAKKETKSQKVHSFHLLLTDEKTRAELVDLRFSRLVLNAVAISLSVLVVGLIFCAIAFTPVRTIIPGYPDAHSKRVAIQNAIRADSLETAIYRWELYTENFRRILDGEEPLQVDSIIRTHRNLLAQGKSLEALSQRDSLLRRQVDEQEQFALGDEAARKMPIEGIQFFTPLKGVVSQGYDPVLHPYIDIAAAGGSTVMSVLDGTVIYAGWDEQNGYTLLIQHPGDLLSAYKHNRKLLHRQGDRIKAGTPVAMVGSTDSPTNGDHLHFELWYRGEAVDPTRYINF